MKMLLKTLGYYLIGLSLAVVAAGIFVAKLQAASYNVFFNNVEQGANSTSSPSLQVSDGKAQKKADQASVATGPGAPGTQSGIPASDFTDTLPHQEISPETVAKANLTPGVTVAQPPVPQVYAEDQFRHFRLALSGLNIQNPQWNSNAGTYGGMLTASFFPLRDLGFSLYGAGNANSTGGHGLVYGGDVEVVPLHLSIFGSHNAIEAGALIGASNINTFNLSTFSDTWGTVHAGARLTFNFGDRFGITTAVRTNLTDRSLFHYVMAEAGLTLRL